MKRRLAGDPIAQNTNYRLVSLDFAAPRSRYIILQPAGAEAWCDRRPLILKSTAPQSKTGLCLYIQSLYLTQSQKFRQRRYL